MNIPEMLVMRIVVHCNTPEKSKAFLEECTAAGVVWAGTHEKPNAKDAWKFYKDQVCYILTHEQDGTQNFLCLEYCNYDWFKQNGYNIIEYVPQSEQFVLHITHRDRNVSAILYTGKGRYVKHTTARCHPNDHFVYAHGRDIAIARLFGLEMPDDIYYAFCTPDVPYTNKRNTKSIESYKLNVAMKDVGLVAELCTEDGTRIKTAEVCLNRDDVYDYEAVRRTVIEILFRRNTFADTETERTVLDIPSIPSTIHLYDINDKDCGVLGQITPLTDIKGTELCVGDTVNCFRIKNGNLNYIRKAVVCTDGQLLDFANEHFERGCSENYVILHSKSYLDIVAGTTLGRLHAVSLPETKAVD